MKIILHMAISIDGFIAKLDGDSDWVSGIDNELFRKRIAQSDAIVVGRKTFAQYQNDIYPIKGKCNIILSHKRIPDNENDVFFIDSPQKVIEFGHKKGFKQMLLAGGGHLNGSFLESNLINEIFLSVHPIILNSGIKLFESRSISPKLNLIDTRELGEGIVELHYEIIV